MAKSRVDEQHPTSHAVAGEHSLAALAQPASVLLQALLNCQIVS
jgi:hypothetical protein